MKAIKLINLLIFALYCQAIYSQNNEIVKSFNWQAEKSVEKGLNSASIAEALISQFKIPENYEFKRQIIKGTKDKMIEKDDLGYIHERYVQYYKGIKVEHSDIRIHYLNGAFVSGNGEYIDVPNIDISITLSKENAIQKAIEHIGAKEYMWESEAENNWLKSMTGDKTASLFPKSEIIICKNSIDPQDTTVHIAYKVDIFAKEPLRHDYVYVDAKTGDILAVIPILLNVNGTAQTRYSGTRTISTQQNGTTYRLRDYSRGGGIETYNFRHYADLTNATTYAIDFTDNDNNWTTAEYHNTSKDDGALDAHWGAMMTYDYFKNVHERNSYDNNNGVLKNYVHYSTNYDNAGWSELYQCMVYGDGYTIYDIVTPLDVTAHEIGHGVCQFSAGLVYSGESGAINESLSDIWGACVGNWATTNKQIWLIGEDITLQATALRSMSNPNAYGQPDTYQGTNWFNTIGCVPHPQRNDNCGVHINSGVMNYWFYLLSSGGTGTNDKGNWYNVTGIGINRAAQIVYRAEAYYMTASTNFSFARMYTVAAATNLYGATSAEVAAVEAAWHAVGVAGSNPLTINGSKLILNAGSTFTLSGNSGGASVTWTWSDNLQKLSSSSTSITVKPVSATSNGAGWIQARAGNFVQQIAVWVGKPVISAITGERRVPNWDYASFTAQYDYNAAILGFQWILNPLNGNSVYGSSSANLDIAFYNTGNYQLLVRATNVNGTGEYFGSGVSVYDPSYYSNSSSSSSLYRAYPNPVSDELTVSLNTGITSVPALPAGGNKTDGNKAYTVYLYNANGASVRQSVSKGDQTQLNVSGLPGGIYYLMIDTGDGSRPEVHKIIVKH